MNVQQLIHALNKVENKSLPVIVIDGASGCSYELSCYGEVEENDCSDTMSGVLVDEPEGMKYVVGYLD